MISLKNDRFWHIYKKMPKNVEDLGKLIVAKGLSGQKSNKSPNLVTLFMTSAPDYFKRA